MFDEINNENNVSNITIDENLDAGLVDNEETTLGGTLFVIAVAGVATVGTIYAAHKIGAMVGDAIGKMFLKAVDKKEQEEDNE